MGYNEPPRRVVRPNRTQSTTAGPTAATGARVGATNAPAPHALSTELLKPRSAELLDAVRRLDARLDDRAGEELVDWIRETYATSFGGVPQGFVAVCFLGAPYIDHQLDLTHRIVAHYTLADRLPDPFGPARMLVRSGAYAYVEVYAGGMLVPVLEDGSVVRP